MGMIQQKLQNESLIRVGYINVTKTVSLSSC